ncbi:TSN31-like protein [Mya arenaria]|uniref:TSN31-like protein n=1 Tax=Mya arenaria TaxID=6604 RepID=A0ABY7E4Y7_MYAAR|nr:TSN31-like protein [Mya arenaria]
MAKSNDTQSLVKCLVKAVARGRSFPVQHINATFTSVTNFLDLGTAVTAAEIVSFILIGVGAYAKAAAVIVSLSVVGVVCLAVNKNQQIDLMRKAWMTSSNYTKSSFQEQLDCCGFEDPNLNSSAPLGHPTCSKLPCCSDSKDSCCTSDMTVTLTATQCSCQPCLQKANEAITTAFGWSGSLGLIFSFTEILGVWLAFRYRHLRDPRANPDAFL